MCTSSTPGISSAALDCLSTLAQISDKIKGLDITLIYTVVDILCSNIKRLFIEFRNSKKPITEEAEQFIADHFYCLLDWVMCNSTHMMNNVTVTTKLFEAIELGLLGQTVSRCICIFINCIYF